MRCRRLRWRCGSPIVACTAWAGASCRWSGSWRGAAPGVGGTHHATASAFAQRRIRQPGPGRLIHPAGQPGPEPGALLNGLLATHRTLRSEPGTRSSYSSIGTLALGQAMATAGGQPYITLARDEILTPLFPGYRQG